jgi:tetratricopeptide (TPR) repeat protein
MGLSGAAAAQEPVAPEALMVRAELAYRAADYDSAREQFVALIQQDPWHTRAWLRLGNIHHRAGRIEEARMAYRHAASGAQVPGLDDAAPDKARLNLAFLALDEARTELDALEASGSARLRQVTERAREASRLAEARAQAQQHTPHLVERWAARPQRRVLSGSTNAVLDEPLLDNEVKDRPDIEYLQGQPRGARAGRR